MAIDPLAPCLEGRDWNPPKTLVIIPAFNEEASLAHVVGRIREHAPWADIAVVNDGSEDRTGSIADDLGVIVLHMPFNVGIGATMQTGFMYAARHGYEAAVQNDGDGQHDPCEIPALVQRLLAGDADIVVGSRYLEPRGYVTPPLRRLGIVILAGVLSVITRRRITDPTSGFRASNRRVIRFCARLYPHDYPEPESVALFWRAGLKLREMPVTMNPRYGGQSSIRYLKSIYYMVKVLLAIGVGLLRKVPKWQEVTHV
ncbi:MAG: glycosyltransferase family 2 protein [Anaerolineae bacterium]|nr:glycosyltransferase family 2 protein [Anaerolineae bacterium]